jgi:DNA replication protein DnaC
MKGGALSSDWNTMRTKLNEIMMTNIKNFRLNLIKYYTIKNDKYKELIKIENNKSNNSLIIDAQNKYQIIENIKKIRGNTQLDQETLEAITETYKTQILNVGNAIQDSYDGNDKKMNYITKQKLLEERVEEITYDGIKIGGEPRALNLVECLKKFLEICDTKFDTVNLNNLRIELCEALVSINSGMINLKTYTPFNLILSGNPGIGKSYNAQIIAEAFKYSLLLAKGDVIYIKKPEIIGQYIGQTAPLVYKKLVSGLENVIFIDEAYSIAGEKQPTTGYDKYGVEALDALTDFTSEHQSLFSVIAAGYPNEMKTQFLEVNPGLPRRFPNNILLSRYTLKDIVTISEKTTNSLLNQISKKLKENYIITYKSLYLATIILLTNIFNYTIPVIKMDTIDNKFSNDHIKLFGKEATGVFYKLDISENKHLLNCQVNIKYFNQGAGREESINIFTTNLETGQRNPFNYANPDNVIPGIEWFTLTCLLHNTTTIPDGDLFKNQAADFNDYANNMINFIVSYYTFGRPTLAQDFKDLITQFLFSISSREPSIKFNVEVNQTGIIVTFEDTQNYIQQAMNNYPLNERITNTKQQVFNAVFDEYKELKNLKEDSADRPYKIFSLAQIKSMEYNSQEFYNYLGEEEEDDL